MNDKTNKPLPGGIVPPPGFGPALDPPEAPEEWFANAALRRIPAPGWTDGEWEVEVRAGRGAWVRVPMPNEPGGWAYTALACGRTDAEADANAQLIANAPALYLMLERACANADPLACNPWLGEAFRLLERARTVPG